MNKQLLLRSLTATGAFTSILLTTSCGTIAGIGQDVQHLGKGVHQTAVKSSQAGAWGSKPAAGAAAGDDPYLLPE